MIFAQIESCPALPISRWSTARKSVLGSGIGRWGQRSKGQRVRQRQLRDPEPQLPGLLLPEIQVGLGHDGVDALGEIGQELGGHPFPTC
jgi:hypothetical protein